MKRLQLLLLLLLFLNTSLEGVETSQIPYLISRGRLKQALHLYNEHVQENGHNHELLQRIALTVLETDLRSRNFETQGLAVIGAGLSTDRRIIPLIGELIQARNPAVQNFALDILLSLNDEKALRWIQKGASSNYLPIRLKALCYLMSEDQTTSAGGIESLIHQLPPPLLPVLAEPLAQWEDRRAIFFLKKLLSHPSEPVRLSTLSAVGRYHRDEFLNEIRMLARHLSPRQQECCAALLGSFKDTESLSLLQQLRESPAAEVKIAAALALESLGHPTPSSTFDSLIKEGNLFAIHALGDFPSTTDKLLPLLEDPSQKVQINATLALLKQGHPASRLPLEQLLLKTPIDRALVKKYSPGRTLTYWDVLPSATDQARHLRLSQEDQLSTKEEVLLLANALSETEFLALAETLFEKNQGELMPLLTCLVADKGSVEAVNMLQHYQNKIGAPLVRHYCTLALLSTSPERRDIKELKRWLTEMSGYQLIDLHHDSTEQSEITLTKTDRSLLMMAGYEALIELHDSDLFSILIDALHWGHPKNRSLIAGVLLKATH